MRKQFLITAVAAIASMTAISSLTGCNTNRQTGSSSQAAGTVATATASETKGVISKALYGEWLAMDVNGQTVTGDDRPYIIFEATPENPFILNIYANNGCNTLNGQMSVTPGGKMVPASTIASTMMMCPDAPYEMGFTLGLNNVKKYTLEKAGSDYILYMRDASDKALITLRKSGITFLNGAWSVTSVNSESIPAEMEMQLVIDIPELKIHGNAGCNTLNGSVFIDPAKQNSVQFTDLATTRMTCPFIAKEQALLIALEQVDTAQHGSTPDEVNLLDAGGKTVITLKRLNLK